METRRTSLKAPATGRAAARPAPGRLFLKRALGERSPARLTSAFAAAIAAEGARRHLAALHRSDGTVELLACDYPFAPAAAAEFGCLRFEFDTGTGESVAVAIGGLAGTPDRARRARLHGHAALYAACLPPLAMAGEPGVEGEPLTPRERRVLERLMLGAAELDIAGTEKVPVRTVEIIVASACAKLGALDRRTAFVVAAQRKLLNNGG